MIKPFMQYLKEMEVNNKWKKIDDNTYELTTGKGIFVLSIENGEVDVQLYSSIHDWDDGNSKDSATGKEELEDFAKDYGLEYPVKI